ncbi:MAG: hypothetical protein ACO3PX_17885 [bacterium]|jgi:hypothetical protein
MNVLTAIDQAKDHYRSVIHSDDDPKRIPADNLTFAWGVNNILKVKLHFVLMDSPTGYPYTRMTCDMRLNGRKISRKQLEFALTHD